MTAAQMDHSTHELKRLQSEIGRLGDERAKAQMQLNIIQRTMDGIDSRIKVVQGQVDKLKVKSGLIVSEHAIIRFIERVLEMDLTAIKQQICGCDPEKLVPMDGVFPIGDHKIRIRSGVVVTVLTKEDEK